MEIIVFIIPITILNNKYKKFIDLGINVNINIYVPEQLNISQTDLCSIFANTIDNAIDACSKIQDKMPGTQTLSQIRIKV